MSAETPLVYAKAAPKAASNDGLNPQSRECDVHQSWPGWRLSEEGLWDWHGQGMGWWREWQDGYRATWAARRFIGPSGVPRWWSTREDDDNAREDDDNPREDDAELNDTMLQWERGAGSVPTITSRNDDRADEANVAAVAAGGTESADGDRSDVSSEVFWPAQHGDPVATVDMMDYEEFVATHGACAFAELQQLAASTQGALRREMNDAVAADDFGPEFWRGWNEETRRALAPTSECIAAGLPVPRHCGACSPSTVCIEEQMHGA